MNRIDIEERYVINAKNGKIKYYRTLKNEYSHYREEILQTREK